METLTKIGAILGIIGGFFAIVAFFQQRYAPKSLMALKEELTRLVDNSIAEVDGRLTQQYADIEVLKKQIGLFWGMAERQMSLLLHSPHREELDKLLDKNIDRRGLTREEADDLVELLHKFVESGELTSNEIGFATLLMSVTVGKYELEDKYESLGAKGH